MFRLRKWKNFPYVTYLIGMTFWCCIWIGFLGNHSSTKAPLIQRTFRRCYRQLSDMLSLSQTRALGFTRFSASWSRSASSKSCWCDGGHTRIAVELGGGNEAGEFLTL